MVVGVTGVKKKKKKRVVFSGCLGFKTMNIQNKGLDLYLLVFILCSSATADSSDSPDAKLLLHLKSGIIDSGGFLVSWTDKNAGHHCSWAGIVCDDLDRIVSLDISNMNLTGRIRPEIGHLHSLINLTIAANSFTGPFPSDITNVKGLRSFNISNNNFCGTFPSNFSKLKELELLDVYNNNFNGSLPVGISELTSLKHLHLGGNYFSGSIPTEYGKLESLEYLALSENELTGKIPAELGNLRQLQQLYIGYNNDYDGGIPSELGKLKKLTRLDMVHCGLSGPIPPELGNLRCLDTLFLYGNSLCGPIPTELSDLGSLKSMDLSINELTGGIPEEFAKLKEITLLNLFINRLHGVIPLFIGVLPNLEVLQLWENNFTGGIPQQLGRNGKLLQMDLSSNKLTGFIPPDLCVGGKLQRVILLDNFFFGPIPEALGTCKSLTKVRMAHNSLNGSIPKGLLNLPMLDIIELHDNYLSGSIPEQITVTMKLGLLSLSNNRLTGSLPASIGNFSGLQTLLLDGNEFTGSVPHQIGGLKQLSKMDFSSNRFSGQIPSEISRCKLLAFIDLSRNELSGPIPPEITLMRILNYLNISRNHLIGSVPREIENMPSLTAVDFSYNNLSGLVPGTGQFSYFNATSFLGNPELCGPYLGPCKILPKQAHSKGPLSSTFKLTLVLGVLICSMALAIVAVVIKGRALMKGNALRQWKLTAFQTLDFTCEDVLECLKEENIIGKGGAGTVYRGLVSNGKEIAVKRLAAIVRDSSHDHGFAAEIQTLGRIRHRHIVRLLGFCSNHETNLLVYEYMSKGSLGEILHGEKGDHLHWDIRYKIAIEAAKGLCYLHHDCSPHIVHRDVKSNNILLDSNFEAHVADFGLAKFLKNSGTSEYMSAIAGSYGYIAPEYAYTLKVNEKSDVYSFGVVLLELITGKKPVGEFGEGVEIVQWVKEMTNSSSNGGVLKVLDARLSSVPLHEVMHVFYLAMMCVEEQSAKRPTMREVVQFLTEAPKVKPSEGKPFCSVATNKGFQGAGSSCSVSSRSA